ncbi:uncharacterized protein N7515_007896 [Penicillium bovifimosum]|uniref:Uncharacterized protein n=1 Tax=Penicillium bovifimosum TaxID=126998 RepID=A0A9W9GLZ7_9EURO|nr:uncharacterized protein N7515_007896 [Penicillium bovifimosum]KAJ5124071.1 hypothetical protein N7515_007896 [Penicillium bovifimosum]
MALIFVVSDPEEHVEDCDASLSWAISFHQRTETLIYTTTPIDGRLAAKIAILDVRSWNRLQSKHLPGEVVVLDRAHGGTHRGFTDANAYLPSNVLC